MTRRFIIESLIKFLNKENNNKPIGELLFEPKCPKNRRRSVFLTNLEDKHLFENLISGLTSNNSGLIENSFEIKNMYYPTPQELLTDSLLDLNDRALENNWRSRMYKISDVVDLDNQALIDKFLKSSWRLFIRQKDNDYFTRHDIVPILWNPGYSIAGSKKYESSIKHSISFLTRIRPQSILDFDFDVIRCFGMKNDGSSFETVGNSTFNPDELLNDTDQITQNIINLFDTYFSQN